MTAQLRTRLGDADGWQGSASNFSDSVTARGSMRGQFQLLMCCKGVALAAQVGPHVLRRGPDAWGDARHETGEGGVDIGHPSSSTPLRRESLPQTAGRHASFLALSKCACTSSKDMLENALHGGVVVS